VTGFALGPNAVLSGYRLNAYDSVGSTNAEAVLAAAQGDPGHLWFAARQQTAGRGRRGRVWESPSGNLAATLLIVPKVQPAVLATLGFVAGVSLRQALQALLPRDMVRTAIDGAGEEGRSRFSLKWPNDLLADGAKLAGILLESIRTQDGRQAVAIGFGVNVVAAPTDVPYPATCLAALGSVATAEDVFRALSDAWVDSFDLWDSGLGLDAVLERWRQGAAGIGAPIAVSQDGVVIRGIFETVDSSGRLVVRSDDHRRTVITAGDVHFGATASARS
jgi:BirA family transcriptional regulator, biotin operon repressor / biotin---[acetyl-CoA-carboxylase] ligase